MKILLTGSLSIDQIMVFDGTFEALIQPDKLHVLSVSTLVEKMNRTKGGIAGNIAYSLALLGEKPMLLGSVGPDAQEYMNDLQSMGVDTSGVHVSELPTATFTVLTDKKDCQVGGFYPGAMADCASLSLEPFSDEEYFIVVSAHDPQQMSNQIDEVLQHKRRFFFDIGQQSLILEKEVIIKGLTAAELLIVNDYELGLIEKTTGLSQADIILMVDVCVITLGSEGADVYQGSSNKKQHVPAIAGCKVVDPTGAGDAFRAGFLYGYLREWDLTKCVKLGATTASFAIEKHGAQEHTFTWKDIADRYKKQYKEAVLT